MALGMFRIGLTFFPFDAEGDEPYRVYKFRKIELEKIPRDGRGGGAGGPADDESTGSFGSPISASYPVENTTYGPSADNYRYARLQPKGS